MAKILLVIMAFVLSACSSTQSTVQPQQVDFTKEAKSIVVFFDGTANDEASRTNVSKLHNLVSLQNRKDIHSIYIQGVGTSGLAPDKLLGMGLGFRIGEDVREGYKFVSQRYNHESGDKIYVFGFSRGAYAARIFAGLIEIAGIANIRGLTDSDSDDLIKDIYEAYKGDMLRTEREKRVQAIEGLSVRHAEIEFMGLWDTVAALGFPDYSENFDPERGRLEDKYFDQLCNIKKAAHALSIDDNRATAFTPTLLTLPELTKHCNLSREIDIHDVVEEVWFAGAHSDVGGGYHDTDIDGVSLNWMLGKIRPYNIVPPNAQVIENPNGKIHQPGSGGGLGLIYRNQNRHIQGYMDAAGYPNNKLPIHVSALERLGSPDGAGKPPIGYNWVAPNNLDRWGACFATNETDNKFPDCSGKVCRLKLKSNQNCFKVEYTDYAKPYPP